MKKSKDKTALRPAKPIFERLKLPLILIGYILLSEWSTPFPFYASMPARLAVIAIILVIFREFHHARMEVDEGWVKKATAMGKVTRSHSARLSRQSWLKIQRTFTWLVMIYAFGLMINSLTTRCDSAVQCAVLAPRLAIENIPTFLQFAIMVSLTLFQLAIMFYAMVKVGSYKVVMPGTVGVTFDDVWGQDDAKQKVMEQVALLENSDEVEGSGGYMPKGLMLYGPPGTGKTYLAKAAANYSSKPLILVPPGAFQATFVGINLLKVWTLFRTIRKLARRYGGVIVFIDEIDSLGSRGGKVEDHAAPAIECYPGCVPFQRGVPVARDPMRMVIDGSGGGMGTLEAFLSAMDGMEEPRGMLNRILVFLGFKPLRPYEYKYLMIGATNMMSRLDPALLRAGRFGRKIHVTFPKVGGRQRTYEGYLSKVTNDLTPKDVEWAARNHAKGTGAEIQDIVNEALLVTFRDDRDDPGSIHFDDLVHAMVWTRYGESEGQFERETARWNTAVHEAGHAVAFHLLMGERVRIWFASIEQRGETGGMVVPTPLDEDWLQTREELMADIQVGLASRVAEQLIIGTTTNGHGGDGQMVTELALKIVNYGQEQQIGAWPHDSKVMREQAETVLKEALEDCEDLLIPRKADIEAVAKLLFDKGTVTGDQIHSMLEQVA